MARNLVSVLALTPVHTAANAHEAIDVDVVVFASLGAVTRRHAKVNKLHDPLCRAYRFERMASQGMTQGQRMKAFGERAADLSVFEFLNTLA